MIDIEKSIKILNMEKNSLRSENENLKDILNESK